MHAIDTSLLYALFNAKDQWHDEAKDLVQRHRPILVPPGILQETVDLVRYRAGAKAAKASLAWLKGTPQFVLGVAGSESSLAATLHDKAPAPASLSFADAWCAAHAAAAHVPLLTKDSGQAAYAARLRKRGD